MTQSKSSQQLGADSLKIGTRTYSSRLIVGTGKYPSEDIAKKAIDLSGSELVTLALKRFSEEQSSENILRPIGNRKLLPNTVSAERIRQIEAKAFKKLKTALVNV